MFEFLNHNHDKDDKDSELAKLKNKISIIVLASKYCASQYDNWCQICGEKRDHEQLFQLWTDDLPLAKTCAECVSMIQEIIKRTRQRKLKLQNL